MQIKALPYPFYRRLPVDDSTPQQAIQRWEKLRLYDRLRRQGCSQKLALEAIGWSRSTYYRWRKRFHTSGLDGLVARSRCPRRLRSPQWSLQDERLVWQMRRRYPFCGKLRLHLFLQQEHGFAGSVSTVGRILAKGVRLGRNFQKGHARALALRNESLPARPARPDRPLQGLPSSRGSVQGVQGPLPPQ